MMKVVFGTVVYPSATCYMEDFFGSLDRQTYKDFRLMIISDNVPKDDIEAVIDKHNIEADIITPERQMTPIELRILMLKKAKEFKADVLVAGDIDDTFSENRVEKLVEAFVKNPDAGFAYNQLTLPNKTEIMPPMPSTTDSVVDILELNYLGLSTTAIKVGQLTDELLESLGDCKTFVFDWYLYCRLLIFGMKGVLADEAATYYRIYDNNFAGVPTATPENIEKEIYIKKNHFDALSKYDDRYKGLFEAYNNGKYKVLTKDKYFWWGMTEVNKL